MSGPHEDECVKVQGVSVGHGDGVAEGMHPMQSKGHGEGEVKVMVTAKEKVKVRDMEKVRASVSVRLVEGMQQKNRYG